VIPRAEGFDDRLRLREAFVGDDADDFDAHLCSGSQCAPVFGSPQLAAEDHLGADAHAELEKIEDGRGLRAGDLYAAASDARGGDREGEFAFSVVLRVHDRDAVIDRFVAEMPHQTRQIGYRQLGRGERVRRPESRLGPGHGKVVS